MSACRHPYAHQRITDVAKMDGMIGEERWCTLCGHIFTDARANKAVCQANKATRREDRPDVRVIGYITTPASQVSDLFRRTLRELEADEVQP